MTYKQAISTYNGQPVDVDYFPKEQPFQCYDWVVKYMKLTAKLPGNPLMRWTGGVRDFAEHFDEITVSGRKLATYYKYVKNDPSDPKQLPKQGDIIIWSGKLPGSGGYGHTGVVDSATSSGFYSYDQNWGGRFVHKVHHSWGHVLGWMTPRVAPKPASAPQYYRVRAGDVLSRIASRFNTTVTRLLKLNPKIKDADKINIDQRLRVK